MIVNQLVFANNEGKKITVDLTNPNEVFNFFGSRKAKFKNDSMILGWAKDKLEQINRWKTNLEWLVADLERKEFLDFIDSITMDQVEFMLKRATTEEDIKRWEDVKRIKELKDNIENS